MTAQVWPKPESIAVTPPARPETSTGTGLLKVVVPLPSWPNKLLPQHLTPPAVVSAQACGVAFPLLQWGWAAASQPGSTSLLTPLARPTSGRTPEWTPPKHLTSPTFVIAQLTAEPSASVRTPLPRAATSIGVRFGAERL